MLLIAVASLVAVIGVALAISAFKSLAGGRLLGFFLSALFGVVFIAAGVIMLGFAAGLEGLRALTHEEVAARVKVVPTGPQHFDATVEFADGRTDSFSIAGDEIYFDAHVLKWSPHLNVLGLHTSYRLDRIGGRYRSVQQESTARRTIHPLAPPALVDVVAMRRKLPLPMSLVVDAEYGSATYVPVTGPAELELRVSTSGLLIRPAVPR